MGKTRILFLLALGATFSQARAGAATEAPQPPADASATVTVTAEALPVPLDQTPNPVLVIGKQAIDARGASNLDELLQDQLPGQVLRSGGVGTASSIFLGGARPQDTVVTLDGLRLTDVSGTGGVNTCVLQLAGVDRIEVQQGPCSTRFGSDAPGGAVALYSAGSAPSGFSGEVRGGAGNEGILKSALTTAYGWDQGWVRVAGTAQREDQVLDPYNHYRSAGTFLGLGQQLGSDTLVVLNYFNDFAGVPIPIVTTPFTGPDSYAPQRQDFNRVQVLSATVRTQFSPVLLGDLTVGQVLQNRMEPDYFTNLATDPYTSRRNQAVGHLTWRPSSAGSLQLGLDGSEETAATPAFPGTYFASARHLAVMVDGEQELCRDFRAVASVRTERDRQTVPTGTGGMVDNDLTQTTGKLGLNWKLPRGFRFYASAGTGFSNPQLYATMYNAQNGGVTLDNERSRTFQTGLTFAAGPWKVALELSRTLFSSYVFFNLDSYLYQNTSDIRYQTAELKGGFESAQWGLTGFYRNQEARDFQQPAGQQFTSDAVLRRPFQTLGAKAYRVWGDIRVDARWSWIGPRYDYINGNGAAFDEHYNDLGLAAAWAARKDLTFTLRGENLLQPRTTLAQWMGGTRNYQNDASQIFGYPAQPPTVTLEVRYRF
jgi:vitamin B12 transporter